MEAQKPIYGESLLVKALPAIIMYLELEKQLNEFNIRRRGNN